MHFGVVLGDLAALETGPDHEGVHRPFDVVLAVLVAAAGFISADAHRHAGHRLLVDH